MYLLFFINLWVLIWLPLGHMLDRHWFEHPYTASGACASLLTSLVYLGVYNFG